MPKWTSAVCELVRPMATFVVRDNLGLFSFLKGSIGFDDLEQEVIVAISAAYPSFDREKGTLATFAKVVGKRRLQNLSRGLKRQAGRDGIYAAQRGSNRAVAGGAFIEPIVPSPDELDGQRDDEEPKMIRWLRGVHAAATNIVKTNGRLRTGRRTFTGAQALAVGVLMDRMGLSIRATHDWFVDYPELGQSIGLPRMPGVFWFQRAREVNALIFQNIPARRLASFAAVNEAVDGEAVQPYPQRSAERFKAEPASAAPRRTSVA